MAKRSTTKSSKSKSGGTRSTTSKTSRPKAKAKPKAKSTTTSRKKGTGATKGTAKKAATTKAGTKKTATKSPAKRKASGSKVRRPTLATKKADSAAAAALATAPPPDPAADLGLTPLAEEKLPPVKFGKRDLAEIEKALHRVRDQLAQDVDAITQNNLTHSGREMSGDLSGYGFHMADVATDNFAREMELNIATGETDRLRLLEEARDRLQDGTFGRCQVCAEPINVARLKVIPYARLCIRCAEEAERP